MNPSRLPGGTLYAGQGRRQELAPDGTVRRTLPRGVYGEPLLGPAGERVLFVGGDRLSAVDRASGEVAWQFTPASGGNLRLVGLLDSAVVVTDEVGDAAELVVVDPETGVRRGVAEVEWAAGADRVARGDRLYLGTDGGVTAVTPRPTG